MWPRLAGALLLFCLGCDDGSTVQPPGPLPVGPPAAIVVLDGDAQEGPPGMELPRQLVARVVDAHGTPVPGAFGLWAGDGEPYADVTDSGEDGITRNYWTLGPVPGPQRMELWSYDPGTRVRGARLGTFTATAQP